MGDTFWWAEVPCAVFVAYQRRFGSFLVVLAASTLGGMLAARTSPAPWLVFGLAEVTGLLLGRLLVWSPLSSTHRRIQAWEIQAKFFARVYTTHIRQVSFRVRWLGPKGNNVSGDPLLVWEVSETEQGRAFLTARAYRSWLDSPPDLVSFPELEIRQDGSVNWGMPQRGSAPAVRIR